MLTEILNSAQVIEVVDTERYPFIAREMIKQLSSDVLTLDIEMPSVWTNHFLRNLMRLSPMPVIINSMLT